MQITFENFVHALSSRRSTRMNSRWVTSSTLDLLKGCRMTLCVGNTSLRSVRDGVLLIHLESIPWWRPSQKPTLRLGINWKKYRTH